MFLLAKRNNENKRLSTKTSALMSERLSVYMVLLFCEGRCLIE